MADGTYNKLKKKKTCCLCQEPISAYQYCSANWKTKHLIAHFKCYKKRYQVREKDISEKFRISFINRLSKPCIVSTHPLCRYYSREITKLYTTGKIPKSLQGLGDEVDYLVNRGRDISGTYHTYKNLGLTNAAGDVGSGLVPHRWCIIAAILKARGLFDELSSNKE